MDINTRYKKGINTNQNESGHEGGRRGGGTTGGGANAAILFLQLDK